MSGFGPMGENSDGAGSVGPVVSPATLTASGSDQSGAAPVVNRYSTLAGSGGVRMPAATGRGSVYFLYNNTGGVINVYPATGEALGRGGTANAATSFGPYGFMLLIDSASGTWDTAVLPVSQTGANGALLGLNGGLSLYGGLNLVTGTLTSGAINMNGTVSVTDITTAITAHSGGGQGSATALTHTVNDVTTVAAGGDSVVLPSPAAGRWLMVSNTAATNSMNLFPASGHSINNLSANTQVAVAAGKTACCLAISTSKWIVSVA